MQRCGVLVLLLGCITGLDIHEVAQAVTIPEEMEPLDSVINMFKELGKLEDKNEVGMTPLLVASSTGLVRVVKLLLQNGAKVNAQDDKGRSALHWVFQNNLEKKDLKARIDLLIKHGVHPTIRDKDGLTPMHMAVHAGRVAGIKMLKRHRVSLEEPSPHGTPLHFASMIGQWAAIRALVKAGANIEALHMGYPPIHCAAMTEMPAAIKALGKLGANIDSKNDKGMTALHFSIGLGKLRSIRALIWAGADPHAEHDGMTGFEVAGTNITILRVLNTPRDDNEKVEDDYLAAPSQEQASQEPESDEKLTAHEALKALEKLVSVAPKEEV